MSRWSAFFDQQVDRQRARRDPLAKLPWWVSLLLAGLIVALGIAQVALGSGASKVIGVLLLVLVAPGQVVAALASKRAQER
jgi:sorbitol-specific phosphotransferase system component IIBC